MQPAVASRYTTSRINVPMVPLHRNVSNGNAPKTTASTSPISATVPVTTTAATTGVALAPVRPSGCPGTRSRLIANNSRDDPTTQARQQPKAEMLAPRVIRLPTQDPMYDVPSSPSAPWPLPEATNAATPLSSIPNPIVSIAVTTVK